MSKHETLIPEKEKEKVANPIFQQVIKNTRQYIRFLEQERIEQSRTKRAIRVAWDEFQKNNNKNNTVYWDHFMSFLAKEYKILRDDDYVDTYRFYDEELKLVFLLKYFR